MSEQLPVQDLAAKSDSGDLCLPTEMASYCVSCGDDGVTRFLRREIPFFHDVTLAAFECEHCGFRSSDLYTMEFQERGVHIELDVTEIADLDREVVRTEYASIAVPEVELEIPFNAGRKGEISTVEGIISKTAESLEQEQPVRK
ncbi:MAG: putative zinc finger protein ZPR1, partial [Streblomastix strix]